MEVLFLVVGFVASLAGSICGIGGGVLMKPILDALHVISVSAVSFLSSCVVLAMSGYSVICTPRNCDKAVGGRSTIGLAAGAAVGGVLGKCLFEFLKGLSANPEAVGAVQAAALFAVTMGTLCYTLAQAKIRTHRIFRFGICLLIGAALGVVSSFLGIGGGPVNLVVLFFFFSMEMKQAARASLFIIFFSQLTSLLFTVLSRSVPPVPALLIAGMALCGLLGGMLGRKLNRRLESRTVRRLLTLLMCLILAVCVYNFWRLL